MDKPTEFLVRGLEREVDILIDKWGVPHIYAKSTTDLYVAQGFNAARDRLFQIDLWRRRGLGRLSEVFGSSFLEQDRAARLFLYRGDMRAEWLAYGSDTKRITSAFVAGINAYVDWATANPEKLPPEFRMFDYLPSRWEAADIPVMRSHGLFYNVEQELARALTVRDYGIDIENLRRVREPAVELTIPDGLDLDALSANILDTYRLAMAPVLLPSLDSNTGMNTDRGGSNNWVISGDRTLTGRPILANDPHRAVTLPSLRYISHLNAPGLSVIGGGEPGLPGISIGHNGKIAFGLTIFAIDQEDIYVYKTNPDNPDEYFYEGRWESTRTIVETVRMSDAADAEVSLRFTRHGPVVFADPAKNVVIAVRAAWLEPGMAPYLGSIDYMTADTCDDFVIAMNRWGAPGENQVYASPDGTIGWQPGGLIPVRPNWDGTMPVPGDGRYEWDGFYDLDVLPSVRNPKSGWIATANQNNLPEGYPNARRTVTYDWYPDTRYKRVAEVLGSNNKVSIEDCVRLQADHVSLPARSIVELLKRLPAAESGETSAFSLLKNWDGDLGPSSAEATLFEVWYRRHLRPGLLGNYLSKLGVSKVQEVLAAIIPNEDLSSEPRTDLMVLDQFIKEFPRELREVVDSTLARAVHEVSSLLGEEMSDWEWGHLHHATLKHPFHEAMKDPKPSWAALGPVPKGGSGDTVGVSSYDIGFRQIVGSTFRIVIDVGGWDNSVAMNSPGQSSNPDSPHYDDLFQKWASEESFPLLYSREAIESHTHFAIRLLPDR